MVKSTVVPSLISFEAVFIVFLAILTCNGRLFNENSNFSKNAHAKMGLVNSCIFVYTVKFRDRKVRIRLFRLKGHALMYCMMI
jgi:hypothetical protein